VHFAAAFHVERADVEGSLGRKLAQFCVQRDPAFVPSLCPNRAAVVLEIAELPEDAIDAWRLSTEKPRIASGLLVGCGAKSPSNEVSCGGALQDSNLGGQEEA
jgi:hypothetical protein